MKKPKTYDIQAQGILILDKYKNIYSGGLS